MKELLDDIREVCWQRLTNLRTCVFRGDIATDFYQLMDGDAIPVLDVCLTCLNEFQLLLRVVDKRTEFLLLRLTDIVAKEFVYLSLNVS